MTTAFIIDSTYLRLIYNVILALPGWSNVTVLKTSVFLHVLFHVLTSLVLTVRQSILKDFFLDVFPTFLLLHGIAVDGKKSASIADIKVDLMLTVMDY